MMLTRSNPRCLDGGSRLGQKTTEGGYSKARYSEAEVALMSLRPKAPH